MDTITYIIMTAIVSIGLMSVGIVYLNARKAGDKQIPWEKIRPILTETFIRLKEAHSLRAAGYQALEDYAVLLVREQILRTNLLTEAERSLISDDLIRSIIGPRLKEIYNEREGS